MYNTNLLELKIDTVEQVRKLYNFEKPEKLKQAVDILEAWVEKQDHFVKKKYTRRYLEIQLISAKGSIEKAKLKLDKMSTIRTLLPKFFEFQDIKELFEVYRNQCIGIPLPKLTDNHYRVIPYKLYQNDSFKSLKLMDLFRQFIVVFEYLKLHDYAAGYVFIWDISEVSITDLIAKLNLVEFKQIASILLEGQGMQVKSINYVSTSSAIETLLRLVKSVLSNKLANRIHVYKNYDELNKVVPKEILPAEMGGYERSFKDLQDDWLNLLTEKDNVEYFKEMQTAGINETIKKIDRIDEFADMAGSFVSLNVD